MFVFFIHTISTGIQINNILDKIFKQTKSLLLAQIQKERSNVEPLVTNENWQTITTTKTGYYQGLNTEGLCNFIKENEVDIVILPQKGTYLQPNTPIIKYSKNISNDAIDQLGHFFVYSSRHNSEENYAMGIRQITEVGIKAMSPGINDPGTAVMTIDYLTELISLRMQIDDCEIYQDVDKRFKLEIQTVNFDELIFQCFAAYRLYCKHDVILMKKLVLTLRYLLQQPCNQEHYRSVLILQLEIIREDINRNLENTADRQQIIKLIDDV